MTCERCAQHCRAPTSSMTDDAHLLDPTRVLSARQNMSTGVQEFQLEESVREPPRPVPYSSSLRDGRLTIRQYHGGLSRRRTP
eukprot:CAMPEP_0113593352 /NCGR_PEP_ID=MMETSP0015_2-20120614/38388_1 /TAXON_ID=2838 /ORGANISM="Odontella" /LENGTH=82 /DNA_ID=CAMNT_0000500057 /DNA_START=323 /DNA_END=567 /DNA_ORIENTATION=- /assembly_acc=CAM_ASM_000160